MILGVWSGNRRLRSALYHGLIEYVEENVRKRIAQSVNRHGPHPQDVKCYVTNGIMEAWAFADYSNNVSTRCEWTISSQGDHAKIVKRPSCDATSASVSRWS